ncbi:DUF4276 family protein [Amycolatopsis sp. cg5]|uniref:DUF4276 family protein n=1 Tax=Amycolatopsis sp. cg5 TaxID=3238802 RepID=UPI003525FB48
MNNRYRRLHLVVEGQSEEIVVTNVLSPYLQAAGWTVSHSIVITKQPASGPARRGGVSSWSKLENDIHKLLRSGFDLVTTLFDYYAFPADSPGMDTRPIGTPHERVAHVEQELAKAIGDPRFLPNLVLHELETWVFAAADQLECLHPGVAERLKHDVDLAGEPELVNDDPKTAPSKRLLAYEPRYSKTNDGPLAIADLGVERLRAACRHLDEWLGKLQ